MPKGITQLAERPDRKVRAGGKDNLAVAPWMASKIQLVSQQISNIPNSSLESRQ